MDKRGVDPSGNEAGTGAAAGPRPLLGLRDTIALIVGVVIGAGIFKAPAIVAGLSGSAEGMFGMWILGGLVSLAGALCYAELATSCAHPGGDYHFLRRAYGRTVAFLFGWARFSVITTGSIALLAFVFGDYMQQAWPLPGLPAAWGPVAYAAAVIAILSLVNLRGLRSGAACAWMLWSSLSYVYSQRLGGLNAAWAAAEGGLARGLARLRPGPGMAAGENRAGRWPHHLLLDHQGGAQEGGPGLSGPERAGAGHC